MVKSMYKRRWLQPLVLAINALKETISRQGYWSLMKLLWLLISLFLISEVVCPGFQNQGRIHTSMVPHLRAVDSSDSPPV